MSLDERTVRRRKISSALSKVKAYAKAKRLNEVIELSQNSLSENTIRSWMSDGKKAFSAYKINVLLEIAQNLEPIGDKKWSAYEMCLSELGLAKKEQDKLDLYNGIYLVYHDLPHSYTADFSKISLLAKERYRFFWSKYSSRNIVRFCDGFVFIRDEKIMLAGAGKNVSLFSSFRVKNNNKSSLLFGSMIIDDHKFDQTFCTKIALLPEHLEVNMEYVENCKEYTLNSYYEI